MGMFMPNGGIINNFGSIQGILFLEVSLTENWLIFVTRGGETWPSWQLIGAIVIVWGYSIGVSIVIAIVYYLMNRMAWLDNLGRAKRSRADTQMENILSHLSKVAIAHEKDDLGNSRWHLTPKATEAEEDD